MLYAQTHRVTLQGPLSPRKTTQGLDGIEAPARAETTKETILEITFVPHVTDALVRFLAAAQQGGVPVTPWFSVFGHRVPASAGMRSRINGSMRRSGTCV